MRQPAHPFVFLRIIEFQTGAGSYLRRARFLRREP
jgi:hypothetical protein